MGFRVKFREKNQGFLLPHATANNSAGSMHNRCEVSFTFCTPKVMKYAEKHFNP